MIPIEEILEELKWFDGTFPRAALEAAVAERDETAPELLRILADTVEHAEQLDAEDGYMGHVYAMLLLAQFRDVRAYPLVVDFAALSGELQYSLCGDFMTESFPQVLASVCGGELGGIQSIIENETFDEWVRGAAVTSLVTLVATGQTSRDEVLNYFQELFRSKLERRHSNVWDELVASTADLHPGELISDIEQAYRDGLVDPGFVTLENIRQDAARNKEAWLGRLAASSRHQLVEDTVREMEWWACFNEIEPDIEAAEIGTSGWRMEPTRRTGPKTGRNEPCPCGSGKKFKRCCGR